MITGSSVHNQQIERLWRDVFQSVIGMFYRLFYHMEHHDLLNPTNEIHLFALHYIFYQELTDHSKNFNHLGTTIPLGQNTTVLLINGLSYRHSETLQSQEKPLEEPPKEQATRLNLILSQVCRLGPHQTSSVKVCFCNHVSTAAMSTGVIVPNEETLAVKQCDVLEGL